MTLAIINNWHKRQLDFVIAFPQADIERELYMRLPAGFSIDGLHLTEEEKKKHVLRLTYMVRNKLVEYGINIWERTWLNWDSNQVNTMNVYSIMGQQSL